MNSITSLDQASQVNLSNSALQSSYLIGEAQKKTLEKTGWICLAMFGGIGVVLTSPLILAGGLVGRSIGMIKDSIHPQKQVEIAEGAFYPEYVLEYKEMDLLYGIFIGSLGSAPLLIYSIGKYQSLTND